MNDDGKPCPGLFGPCYSPVTHYLESIDGRPPLGLCTEHWNWTMQLEAMLDADPEFKRKFAEELEKAESGGIQ